MKLFINVSNLRFGGGKTVGMNIVDYYLNNIKIEKIILVAPSGCGYEVFLKKNRKIKIIFFPEIFNKSFFKLVSNYIVLPFLSVVYSCNFILSLGNIAFPSLKRQFVLIHQPYLAYPESIVWHRIRVNDLSFYKTIKQMLFFIRINLRYAKYIGVQTETMKERISKLYNIPNNNVFVIPNAVSFTSKLFLGGSITENSKSIRLLFLSKYYPHKNFEILLDVGKEVKKRGLPISFTVTINENENIGGKKFLEEVAKFELENVIINIGNVDLKAIPKTYEEHDGLFLPTLLESFSGTYIEAMYFNKPIFTSNLDFAKDVCKDVAFYFNPLDVDDILTVISEAFSQPELISSKIGLGKVCIQNTKSWNDIGGYIDNNILNI